MSRDPLVRVGSTGLVLAGGPAGEEHLPFLSGAMHYFQVPRRHWCRCLDRFVELGLPLVESYVPWGVHERGDGRFDFGGGPTRDRFERDLGGFLAACAERGLRVILRPGPHVNAELTYFGFPERLLADQGCLAVGARGNPVILPLPPRSFPVPSYASERFLQQAGSWLKAFGDFVAPHCWPDGPLVAVGVDNEMTLFFRTGAYDQDYHPDAMALYRRFLRQRYPDGLPRGYGERSGAEVDDALEPPRRFAASTAQELVVHLDWVAFKEWMIGWALGRLAKVLRITSVERLLLLHNLPALGWGDPSLALLERELDLVGLDFYQRRKDYAMVRRAARLLAGSSRLPLALELGCGGWPWWHPLSLADQQAVSLSLLMHGVKGFNLYMLVERDRWYGAPVRSDGSAHPERFRFVKELVRAVSATGLLARQRRVELAVMRVRDYERLGQCTSLLDPIPPALLDLLGLSMDEVCPDETHGLSCPVARQYDRVLSRAEEHLSRLRVPFHLVESDLPSAGLARYRLLVVPAFDFLDQELVVRLQQYVAGGGTLVLTPQLPRLDGQMGALGVDLPRHLLAPTDEALEQTLEREVHRLGLDRGEPQTTSEQLELALFEASALTEDAAPGRDEPGAVLFVANPCATPCVAEVTGLPWETIRACDALGGDPVDLDRLRLGPFQVRMLRLDRSSEGSGG